MRVLALCLVLGATAVAAPQDDRPLNVLCPGGCHGVEPIAELRSAVYEHFAACHPWNPNGPDGVASITLGYTFPGPPSVEKLAQAQRLINEAKVLQRCEDSEAVLRRLIAPAIVRSGP